MSCRAYKTEIIIVDNDLYNEVIKPIINDEKILIIDYVWDLETASFVLELFGCYTGIRKIKRILKEWETKQRQKK